MGFSLRLPEDLTIDMIETDYGAVMSQNSVYVTREINLSH